MKAFILLILLSLISSCVTGDGTTSIEFLGERGGSSTGSTTPIANAVVSNVTLNSNNELVITGSSLNIVDSVKITGPSSYNQAFQIKSKTATQLIIGANTTFAVNALLNLIFTNATGAATHTINFALADASVTGAKLATGTVGVDRLMNGSTVGTNEFLKWDGSKFVGEAIAASQVMLGDWNADTNRTSTSGFTQAIADDCAYDGGTANNGEYFVVTTADPAQPIDGVSSWAVKDWIMCSSSNWIKITRTSVSDNSDVDTTGSTSGGILYFNNNNARWEATGEVSVTVGTVVEFANDVKVGNLAGGGTRCIQVDNNGQLQAASCATANTGIDGGSGGSVSATSGDVTVVAASNKTVTTTVGGSTIVQVDQAGMSMNGYAISNVATPTTDQDVANKGYVDAAIAGAGADDLGNHTATQNLNLAGFNITNPGLIAGVNINSVTENATAVGAHGLSISANLTAINNNALLLGGRTLTTQTPNSGQVLKWDGSKWAPGNDNSGAGGGIVWTATGPEQIHSSRLTDTNNTIASLSSTITANQASIGVLNNSVTTLEAAGQWSKSSNDILYLSGKVGIGTTSPTAILHVEDNLTSIPLSVRSSNVWGSAIEIHNTGTGGQNYSMFSSGSSNVGGPGKFHIYHQNSAKERLTIDSVGSVGIGTPSPTVKLEIAADTDSSAPVGGLGCAFNGVTCNCNTNYTFHDNDLDGLVDAGECYERSIYSKGTIGLGTTDPKAKLHIQQGHAIFESNLNAANGSLLVFEKSRGAAVVQDQDELGVIDFYGTSSAPAYTRAARIAVDVDGSNINATQIPGQINFYTDDGSVSTSGTVQRMVIKSTGEVGIGLNNPMAQLGVNGELGLTEMAVDPTSSAGWGKLFVSQADNKLYYMSEAGVKTDLLAGGGGGSANINDQGSNIEISGNVGAGGVSATYALTVPGGAGTTDIGVAGNTGNNLTISAGANTGGSGGDLVLQSGESSAGGSSSIEFRTVNGSAETTATVKMVIDSSGNVGIGTTSPTEKLHVAGTLRLVDGTQGAGKVLVSDANGVASWTTSGGGNDNLGNHTASANIQLGSNYLSGDGDNEGIVVNSSGAVGIGTSGPGAGTSLHVYGTGDVITRIESTTNAPILQFLKAGVGKFSLVVERDTPAYDMTSGDIGFYNEGTGNTDLMIKSSDGNVGIGATNPLERLEVADGSGDTSIMIKAGTPSTTAGTSSLKLNSYRADTGVGHVSSIESIASGAGQADLAFKTQPSNGVYSERMRITDDGNVGIGSTSPTANFEVSDIDSPSLKVTDSDANLEVIMQAWDGGSEVGWLGTLSSHDMRFGTSGSVKMSIQDSSGNVGIGTTSPSYRLDISESGSTGSDVDVSRIYANASATAGARQVFGTFANPVGAAIEGKTTAGDAANLNFYTESGGILSQKMTILGSGNVGIGTAAPSAPLDISSTSGLVLKLQGSNSSYTNLQLANTNAPNSWNILNTGNAGFGSAPDGSLIFDESAGGPRLTIVPGGNVGIGTSSPTVNLDIDGEIRIRGGTPAAGRVLAAVDGTGLAEWTTTSGGGSDNLGDHTATSNITFGGYWLSGDGSDYSGLHVDSSGNVGIGTTSSGYGLEVGGETKWQSNAYFDLNVGIGTNAANAQLDVGGILTSVGRVGIVGTTNGRALGLEKQGGGEEWHIGVTSTGDLYFEDGSSDKVMFFEDGTGNVGIGTTVANKLLHIEKNQNADTILRIDNNDTGTAARLGVTLNNDDSNGQGHLFLTGVGYTSVSGWIDRMILGSDSAVSGGVLIRAATGGVQLTGNSGQTNSPDLYVATDGNVGIGTATPTAKLHVEGRVLASTVRLDWLDTTSASDGTTLTSLQNATLDVSSGAYSLGLPDAPSHGDVIKFIHAGGTITSTITVTLFPGTGDTIINDSDLILDVNNISIDLFFHDPDKNGDGDWRLH